MSQLSEAWLQEVAASNRVSALRPAAVNAMLPPVEVHLRHIIEQAYKFTRRGKGQCMTVRDVNLALSNVGAEPLHGLVDPPESGNGVYGDDGADGAGAAEEETSDTAKNVNLLDLAKQPLLPCPLLPDLSLHWLAVEGAQPQIPENPRLLGPLEQQEQLQLPKEMRQFYYRATSILLRSRADDRTCRAVLAALRGDSGLQELLPHMSQFIEREVKANSRSLCVLHCLVEATDALWSNPHLSAEFHLQQMLPAAFTCILAAKLCGAAHEDHWALRQQAAKSIAKVLRKFRVLFPDLQARVCRTYVDALGADRALTTVCGGIMGLTALGHGTVQALLVPRLAELMHRVSSERAQAGTGCTPPQAVLLAAYRTVHALVHATGASLNERRRLAMHEGVWPSLYEATPTATTAVVNKEKEGPKRKKRKAQDMEEPKPTEIAVEVEAETGAVAVTPSGLEEGLIPYYACAAPEAAHLRLLI